MSRAKPAQAHRSSGVVFTDAVEAQAELKRGVGMSRERLNGTGPVAIRFQQGTREATDTNMQGGRAKVWSTFERHGWCW